LSTTFNPYMNLKKLIALPSSLIILLSITGCIGMKSYSYQKGDKSQPASIKSENLTVNKQESTVSPNVQEKLPFIGTRYFNFEGGNGTGQSITIKEDGTMLIQLHGTVSTLEQYRGEFTNPITLEDGQKLLIKENKIYRLSANGDVAQGCKEEEKPCVSELYEPSVTSIVEGFYVIGGTDQGLEVSGRQYRYYDELGNQEWQPISDLTSVSEGVVYDGKLYWCIPPQSEAGVCTENGWKSIQSYQSETRDIDDRELALGGLVLGESESKVVSELGQPLSRSVNPIATQLEYQGLSIDLDEDQRIMGMKSTSVDYCTPSGICPGLDFAQVREVYGSPVVSDRKEGRFMEYYSSSPNSSCWLKIALNGDIVKSVEIACQP
jgi:hypothetical protein